MQTIFSSLKKLDYYSNSYQLQENLNYRHQTLAGSFATIIMFIATLVLSFMFGNEIYKRDDPFASTSKQYNTDSIVLLKEFPIMFNFYTKNRPIIKNIQDYVNFNVSIFEY